MAILISFETSLFDLRKEPRNPITPIHGHSALVWLRKALAPGLERTEPAFTKLEQRME